MLIQYAPLPSSNKEKLKSSHPFGVDLVESVEWDLSRDPVSRARLVRPPNQYAQIFTPPLEPLVEIRVAYLAGDGVLIKVFDWKTV